MKGSLHCQYEQEGWWQQPKTVLMHIYRLEKRRAYQIQSGCPNLCPYLFFLQHKWTFVCVSSQPSPACLVSWSTCRRITSTGRAWTRWSVRACVLLLLLDQFLAAASSHPSLRAGRDSECSPAVEQLVSSAVIRRSSVPSQAPLGRVSGLRPGSPGLWEQTSLTDEHWDSFSNSNHSLFSCVVLDGGNVLPVENRLSFEGPIHSLLLLYGPVKYS